MKKAIIILGLLTLALNTFALSVERNLAKDFKGFVKISKKQLYVDYVAPEANRPTLVLLNGLTYSTVQWDEMTADLHKLGFGVLRYDMDGMGKTVDKYGVKDAPYTYQDQVTDLDDLLTVLKLPLPYNIVGLSYGGGIAGVYGATYPNKVKNLFLMSPYTEALKNQDLFIKSEVMGTRMMFPFNTYSDDEIYDYYLKQIVYTTYPSSEPIVLQKPNTLEAVFRMTQGIRKLRLADYVSTLPKNSVHLFIAQLDQYIPRYTLLDFWSIVPAQAKGSINIIPFSEHKIPESRPQYASDLINKIISEQTCSN